MMFEDMLSQVDLLEDRVAYTTNTYEELESYLSRVHQLSGWFIYHLAHMSGNEKIDNLCAQALGRLGVLQGQFALSHNQNYQKYESELNNGK